MTRLDLRTLRLRGVWLLLVPFVILARPAPASLALGGALAMLGVALRGWAAGLIYKDRELSTSGPYALTRNPLYLGSFLIGFGAVIASARWELVLLFLAFYVPVYGAVMRSEARSLEARFGARYAAWARAVPLFWPRLAPARSTGKAAGERFSLARWRRNREYEALLGVAVGFAFLAARLLLR